MFQVFDCDKPADSGSQNLSKGVGWDNSTFPTLGEAQDYSANYFFPFLEHWDSDYKRLEIGEIYEYLPDCFAEIKEV
jgi:hypothetical protein